MRPVSTLMLLAPLLAAAMPLAAAMAAPPAVELVVVYKSERVMQLLSANRVIRSYRVALGRNPVGAKERAGDCRTPEGSYVIDRHNDRSRFHKSLHISYPNSRDRSAAKKKGASPGGEIMIHGLPEGFDQLADLQYKLNWTKGCIAVNNKEIDEIAELVRDGTPIQIKP